MPTKRENKLIMTSKLSRVLRADGRVLAVETLRGVYVLAQVVGLTDVAFFNVFAKDRRFTAADWESASLLFVKGVTDQFFRGSSVYKTDLTPKQDIRIATAWINSKIDPVYRKVVLWAGTRHERRLKVEYSGSLMCDSGKADYWPCKHDFLIKRIRINDRKTIDSHEMDGMGVYPYTNHRLYLCHKLKRNADPIKELTFRRPLPLEYRDVINRLYPKDHF